MGDTTTIKIKKKTKHLLSMFKAHQRQSYDEVIQKIIMMAQK